MNTLQQQITLLDAIVASSGALEAFETAVAEGLLPDFANLSVEGGSKLMEKYLGARAYALAEGEVVKYLGYWIDRDCNFYLGELTQEQARADALSNTGCKFCKFCRGCTGCTYCVSCTFCTDCTDCAWCSLCTFCEDCRQCTVCKYCTGCAECDTCVDCKGCTRCTLCTECAGCTFCTDCVECAQCDWCEGCEELTLRADCTARTNGE